MSSNVQVPIIMKGRGHNRLMSKFGPFFIFGQICLIFVM